jgi:hypothetical protein
MEYARQIDTINNRIKHLSAKWTQLDSLPDRVHRKHKCEQLIDQHRTILTDLRHITPPEQVRDDHAYLVLSTYSPSPDTNMSRPQM